MAAKQLQELVDAIQHTERITALKKQVDFRNRIIEIIDTGMKSGHTPTIIISNILDELKDIHV